MVGRIRYRSGIDDKTGKLIVGFPHCRQSLRKIWTTRTNVRLMRLAFGANLRDHLSEDLTPALALDIYDDLVTAAHRWEPEYRVTSLRFVKLTEQGGLGLAYSGLYYPEGRFGNYSIVEQPVGLPIGLKRALDLEAA